MTLGAKYYNGGDFKNAEATFIQDRAIDLKISGSTQTRQMEAIDWFLCKTLLAQKKLADAQHWFEECRSILDGTESGGRVLSQRKLEYAKLLKSPGRFVRM